MRTDFIRDWVAALRSGEFNQGEQQLRQDFPGREVRHCCLGVACEVGVRYGVIERQGNEYLSIGEAEMDTLDYNLATLPTGFWIWIGLPGSDPQIIQSASLSALNDELGLTFNEIADLIEESWLGAEMKELANA